MNNYTVEPSKSESTAATAPLSPSAVAPFYIPANYPYYPSQYPTLPGVQPSVVQPPVLQPPTYQPPVLQSPTYQPPTSQPSTNQPPTNQSSTNQPNTNKIRDWLAWSIISLFVGGLIPGFLPLVFSLVCRSKKRKNDINGARTMSTLALVFNIIFTLLGVSAIIGLIIYFFVYTRMNTDME